MNLNNILNKPGEAPPPRRPRLSSSYSKDSLSPAEYRQNSVSVTTPISPHAPHSAYPGTPHAYPNPPNSALSVTPSSTASHGAFNPPSGTPTTFQPTTPLQTGPPPPGPPPGPPPPGPPLYAQHYQSYPHHYPTPQPQQYDQYHQHYQQHQQQQHQYHQQRQQQHHHQQLQQQQLQQQHQSPPRSDHSSFKREQSHSVSPKTVHSRLSSQQQQQPYEPSQASQPAPPPPRPPPQQQSQEQREPQPQPQQHYQQQQQPQQPLQPQYQRKSPAPPPTRPELSIVSNKDQPLPPATTPPVKEESGAGTSISRPEPAMESPSRWTPANSSNKRPLPEEGSSPNAVAQPEQEPKKKKRRIDQIPIWARPAKNLKPLPKYSMNGAANLAQAQAHASASGIPPNKIIPKTQPNFGTDGPLGPFEESFRGSFIPQEELTKQICDFLFQHVVLQNDLPTGRAGEAAPIEGQLEIEAKIGTIIDRQTENRFNIPVTTETILRPGYPVAFESMMTEAQHRSFNELLNEALKSSMGSPASGPPGKDPKARIKMTYEHRHEIDTFYELPDEELANLPTALQAILRQPPAHKPSLRVTREKKTGKVLAKIVKARISDMHVYSPSTSFDWRISVNLEANWNGDLDALVKAVGETNTKNHPDRHKNRMSYTHLFCQIDLTQVTGLNKTHELEVELDSTTVREQGKLVMANSDNQYQDLVKGFVDNVRILIRGVE